MGSMKRRLEQLERRRKPQELPPLIIKRDITDAEARAIEREWVEQHGQPGPLIIRLRSALD
jgi:hypothetical protein